jgi:hypothetical protein
MTQRNVRNRLLILGITLVPLLVAACKTEAENTVAVPAGTMITVALQTPLSTASASNGQAFTAVTTSPVVVDGKTVAESGTTVRGYVNNIARPGAIKGGARITLNFEEVVTKEGGHPFSSEPITLTAKADTKSDIERVAGTTVAGAVIGGIVDGGKGAVIGGLIGAGAGGTWAVVTKGDQIVLDPGQKFAIQITETTEMPVLASL